MKVSYNQAIKQINDFATAHEMVQSFGNGNLWEVTEHDQLKNFNYPLLWVSDESATANSGTFTWNFRIILIDIVKKDESNENEVKSDAVQILVDLLSYFEQLSDTKNNVDWNKVQLERSGSIELFTERFDDELSGASMTIGLTFPQNYNYCEVPI